MNSGLRHVSSSLICTEFERDLVFVCSCERKMYRKRERIERIERKREEERERERKKRKKREKKREKKKRGKKEKKKGWASLCDD